MGTPFYMPKYLKESEDLIEEQNLQYNDIYSLSIVLLRYQLLEKIEINKLIKKCEKEFDTNILKSQS